MGRGKKKKQKQQEKRERERVIRLARAITAIAFVGTTVSEEKPNKKPVKAKSNKKKAKD